MQEPEAAGMSGETEPEVPDGEEGQSANMASTSRGALGGRRKTVPSGPPSQADAGHPPRPSPAAPPGGQHGEACAHPEGGE